jgi:pimeloyl-ACP methyl ester carboxylesterase
MGLQKLNAGVGNDFPPSKHLLHKDPQNKEHWFSLGESCLAISEWGPSESTHHEQKHVLFFLHGRFGQGEIWKPLAKRLASHFRCFHLDLPGFGRSFSVRGRGFSILEQSQIVRTVLKRFTTAGSKAVLIGHDIGGSIAQLCAIHEPNSLAGLVLINSTPLTQAVTDLKTGVLCIQARRKLKKLLHSVSAGFDPEHRSLLARAWESGARRASMIQAFQAWDYTWPGPFERKTWREKLSHLPHPVLLLWGRNDPMSPLEQAEELMQYLPDAYLFECDDCGHWPCLENTEWVDLKMREFLFRLAA